MAKNGELSSKQKRMIAALLSSSSIGQACETVRVSRSTLARWLKDPDFQRELTTAEQGAISQVSRELMAGQDEALATMRELMTGAASESVRLRAASEWIATLFKYRELASLEERITKLEEKANIR